MNARFALVLPLFFTACGGAQTFKVAERATVSGRSSHAEAALDTSHFSRDPKGRLSEAALQKILRSPLTIALPARVGILPVMGSMDWRGPSPRYDMPPAGARALARSLPVEEPFSTVTEMLPIPSGALGMEALREVAARYKLRYILLYGERVERQKRVNGWATGYVTLIGALFIPGSTLTLDGYVEASLLDVQTGVLLFTVRRQVSAERTSNLWHRDDKFEALQNRLAVRAAKELAGDVVRSLEGVTRAVRAEADRKTPVLSNRRLSPAESTVPLRGSVVE